jgi:16S rRNA C1402 (ribose-2'-O) methylase RsmI
LTKLHEELVVCTISTALSHLPQPRGEFTVIIPPASPAELTVTAPDARALAGTIGQMIESGGITRRQALREVGKRYGLTTNELYDLLRGTE